MRRYTQILYQIIISTKQREYVLLKKNRPILFKYMSGIIINKKCYLYCINGIENHVHILTDLSPNVKLATLVKDLKVSSSLFIKNNQLFPDFKGWSLSYAAFTYSAKDRERLIFYVNNQENHHRKTSYPRECTKLLKENRIKLPQKQHS